MKEIFRVLKPNGIAILQVPIANKLSTTFEDATIKTKKDRENYFGQFDHVRLYGLDYSQKLKNAGFSVSRIRPGEDAWQVKKIDKYAINKNEYLYIAIKPDNNK